MYHDYLMQARHDDQLRAASQRRLAAQARRARTARHLHPSAVRRLARAWRRPATA
jgi:hypothetical protein